MVETVRTIQETQIPAWLRSYQEDILARAKALARDDLVRPAFTVAERTPLQEQASELAAQGVGAYMPMLQAGAGTVGTGVGALGQGAELVGQGLPFMQQAGQQTQQAVMGASPYQAAAAAAMRRALPATQAGVDLAQRQLSQGAAGVRSGMGAAASSLSGAAQGILPEVRAAQTGAMTAAERARASTGAAQEALAAAGSMGAAGAAQGMAMVPGTAEAFQPTGIASFMNAYEDAAVRQALADIARQSVLAQQGVRAQAVGAGAFGGSRQAIAEQELQRNVLEQQGRTAAQMRAAGFESASQRALEAFEAAQGRQLQGAGLLGQLGATGAGSAAQAARAAGQLGLSAEQLAQTGALSGGKLGLAGQQAAGQMGLQAGQATAQGAQTAGQMGAQAGKMGLAGARQTAAIGEGLGGLGAQYGQLGLQGAQQLGAIGTAYGEMGQGLGALGRGLTAAGLRQAQLGEAYQGLNINDINLLSQMGMREQAQRQAELDASRQTQVERMMQPYQQLGFYSDIYQGMPSTQTSLTQTQQPSPSTLSQLGGLGMGLYSLSQYNQ